MKKRNTANLTLVVLLLVILSLIGVSGTYAKYTTTVTGTGTAIVAKWDFDVTGAENKGVFSVDLGEKVTTGKIDLGNGNYRIQPGSKGSFDIELVNNSEVAANIAVNAVAAENAVLEASQFTFEKPVIKVDGQIVDSIPAGKTATATVDFEWIYHTNAATDILDTTDGETNHTEVQTLINFEIVATQVAP